MRLLMSRHLENFLAVYDAQSMRKAAERNGITQPALTKSVKLLEAKLGLALFQRSSTGIQPTEAGRILHRHATHMINSARYAETEISGLRDGYSGALRIGAGYVWALSRLPEILSEFHRAFPAIDIDVVTGITDRLLPELLAGRIDALMGALPPYPMSADLIAIASWPTRMVAIARAQHPLAGRKRISVRDIFQYDAAGFSADESYRIEADRYFRAHGVNVPRMSFTTTSLETLLGILKVSDHIAIVAEQIALQTRSQELRELHLAAPLWSIDTGMFFGRHVAETAPIKFLRKRIEA